MVERRRDDRFPPLQRAFRRLAGTYKTPLASDFGCLNRRVRGGPRVLFPQLCPNRLGVSGEIVSLHNLHAAPLDGHPPSVAVQRLDRVGGTFEDTAAELLTRAQRLLIHLAFMNIHAGADVPGERLIGAIIARGRFGIEMRRSVIEDPAVLAVMPPQPVFHGEFPAVIESFDVSLKTTLGIIRMDAFGPPVLDLLLDVPS